MAHNSEHPDDRTPRPPRRGAPIRAWAQAAATTAVIVFLYFVVPLRPEDLEDGRAGLRWPGLVIGLVAVTALVRRQVGRALRPGRTLVEQLGVLLTLVVLVATGFAGFYFELAEQFDGLNTRMDALYFSMTTLTSVGYGDIVATGQAARIVVTVQMAFDLIIVATAVSTIVGSLRPPAAPGPARPDEASPADGG